MSQTDKPSLHQGSLAATKVYTGSDAPDTSGDTASPPNGSLYVRRDPTGAAPQGEVGIHEYVPSYTPVSGMSAVPAGWRPLVGGEVINVKRFGATGDGTTDDYPAIAAALAAVEKTGDFGAGAKGAIVFFPPGVYRVTRPLDCTVRQYNLVGSGPHQSVLRGATGEGKAVIDFTGASYCSVRDLMIEGPFTINGQGQVEPTSDSSTVGILIARDSSGGSISQINLENVVVRLVSKASANNGNGTVAVYNFGGEEANYHNVYLRGDCGLVVTSDNVTGVVNSVQHYGYGLTSDYKTIYGSDTSTTAINVTGLSSLIGLAGPALRLNGGAAMQVDAFLSTHAQVPFMGFDNVTRYKYAIHNRSTWIDFRHTGSMETFEGLLHTEVPMFGVRLYTYMGRSTSSPAILLTGTGTLQSADLDITPNSTDVGVVNYLVDDDFGTDPNTGAKYIRSSHIKLRNQKLRVRGNGSRILANVIQSEDPLVDTLSRITAHSAVEGNVITATDGVSVNGVTVAKTAGWGAPTGTATRSAFATGTVTTAQLAERVKALIDDLTTRGLLGA